MNEQKTQGRPRAGWALGALAFAVACGSSSGEAQAPLPTPDALLEQIEAAPSCTLACSPACETNAPWTCPALAAWDKLPHAPECGAFDGKTFPAVVPGRCAATEPSGDALAKAQILAAPFILPDGRRLQPWGKEQVFTDFPGGFPASLLRIPLTRFLAVSDNGYETHSIRIVDADALRAGGGNAVVSAVSYAPPRSLDYGLAYKADTTTLYAAGGTPDSRIYAYDLNVTTGALTANASKDIALPDKAIASGIAISPNGQTLIVGQATEQRVLVYSLEAATYGKATGAIDVNRRDVFAISFDPADPTGKTAYATNWTGAVSFSNSSAMQLVKLNLETLGATVIPVGKSPEEMAFLGPRFMVVANALSDSLTLVDRTTAAVVGETKIGATHGQSPTALAYDDVNRRLYATLAAENSVAVFDVDPGAPSLTLRGRIPTAWWPTSVSVDPAAKALYVLSGRGHGLGTDGVGYAYTGGASASQRMTGSVQALDLPDDAALAAATAAVDAQNHVDRLPGYPRVECNGAPFDFPVPARPEDGASAKIKHVFLIVRENKTFDGIMGDVPGLDGAPGLVMAPGHMELWQNARAIGKTFAQLDNYYIDAEQSIQGHAWTVFGRSTDYTERRWINIWGRGMFPVTGSPGIADDTTPQELNLFQFLTSSGVGVEVGGELIGGLSSVRDSAWPGGSTDTSIPDTLSACYVAWRARVACNPADFTYSWLANDHTFGLAAGKPNPAIMIATNDEATGMYLDGISHSPFWADSLVIVIEDDPSEGGDHVDFHRTIALFASPWIKRGYVSHAHYDLASVHKVISAIYGKPYRNTILENAPMPFDLFTSTPDYTPFDYVPRTYRDTSCNPGGTVGAKAAERWDFADADEQPGLAAQVWQHLHALPGAGAAR